MRRWHVTAASLLAAIALSACNSASDVLQQSAAAPQSTTDAASTGTATPLPSSAPTPAQTAAVVGKMQLQVAPIVGPTVEAAAPLIERLNTRARERGIALAGSTDSNATHVLKGYFSLLNEGKDTSVIYVWDVYDSSGNRLHRINGQQKATPADGAQGWAAVTPQTMQAVADATVDQLVAWLTSHPG